MFVQTLPLTVTPGVRFPGTWENRPVDHYFSGDPRTVVRFLPGFRKVEGTHPLSGRPCLAVTGHWAVGTAPAARPVAWVGRPYALIQHGDFLSVIADWAAGITPLHKQVVHVCLDPCEARCLAFFDLGIPGLADRDSPTWRLYLFASNSVDGRSAASAGLWWVHPHSRAALPAAISPGPRVPHRGWPNIGDLIRGLDGQLAFLPVARSIFEEARRLQVDPAALGRWVDSTLARNLGRGPASRFWHLCSTGRDSRPLRTGKSLTPITPATGMPVELLGPVPGFAPGASSAFSIAHALACVATMQPDCLLYRKRIEWVPGLIAGLLSEAAPFVSVGAP